MILSGLARLVSKAGRFAEHEAPRRAVTRKPGDSKLLVRMWHVTTERIRTTRGTGPMAWGFFVERVTRIELAL